MSAPYGLIGERPGESILPLARYPAPATAELVTIWNRGPQVVLSIVADGKVHDFHLPPARLAVLLREVADMLSEHSVLQ